MSAPVLPGQPIIEQAALSDIGLRRTNNQDSYCVVLADDDNTLRTRGHFFMVADGMGAHAAGELASKLACNGVHHAYLKLRDRNPPQAVKDALRETNAHVYSRGEANPEFHGMGTTASVLVLLAEGAVVGHVGDSRVYRLRGNVLEQLTFDHSLVWEMSASQHSPASAMANFVPKNIITRSLGPHPEVQVDLEGPFPLEPGDSFLICSDGLSGQLKDEELGFVMSALPPKEAVQVMVDLANLRGGPDNITVIIARVNEVLPHEEAPPPPGPDLLARIPPLAWTLATVCFMLGLLSLVFGNFLLAFIGAIAAAAIVGIAFFQPVAGEEGNDEIWTEPHGQGPYRSYDCTPNSESLKTWKEVYQEVRDAAVTAKWNVDWAPLEVLIGEGNTLERSGKYRDALARHAIALAGLMQQIRERKPSEAVGKDEASVLDL